MKLVFLHGAPASGKLTIAKAILQRVRGGLLDNHSRVDFARTIFDVGAPGFWELVQDVRQAAIARAAEFGIPLLVGTGVYSELRDRRHMDAMEALLAEYEGELLPVFLHCPVEELMRRVANGDRLARKKIASIKELEECLAAWEVEAMPRENCMAIDTSRLAPNESASKIIAHFRLDESAL